MILPKIIYPSGGGATLIFAFPPVNVRAYDFGVRRHDTIASSGERQSLLERTDEFLKLDITLVPTGTDPALGELDAWKAWWDAVKGGTKFDYYPDKDLGGFTVYVLEDKKWAAKLQVRGADRFYEFVLRFRKFV